MTLKEFMIRNGKDKRYTVIVGKDKIRYTPRIMELTFETATKYHNCVIIDDIINGTKDTFGNMAVRIEYAQLPNDMYTTKKIKLNGKMVIPLDKTTSRQEKRRAKGGILGLF